MTYPGAKLNGRYRLDERLGTGAMGSVWKAYDQLLDRTVALKELVPQHPGIEDLPRRRERARKEARALAKVEHPAIISIHDLISVGEDPWIVMGYASGRPLDKIIHGNPPMAEPAIASIGLPVLHGLLACHASDVVHRDVKPANIVVAKDKSIRLVDFGIARIVGEATLSQSSKLIGTPEFLAPELLEGKPAGPPSDLWALGVTLYYALEGRSPFYARSIEATITAILYKDPPQPTRPGRLADMILRMLHKEPEARPAGQAVAAVLAAVSSGGSSLARPVGPPVVPPLGPAGPRARPRDTGALSNMPPADASAIISGTSTESGVAALLRMPEASAARILDPCTSQVAGELIGGIAAAQPGRAGTILQIVAADRAAQMLDRAGEGVAASVLAAMQPGPAARILRECDVRTAEAALAEMPPRNAGQVVTALGPDRAVKVLARVAPAGVAAILRVVTEELRKSLLERFSPSFRDLIRRYL
jgi:tRNA A-37 threonylcarbamoyl transferase component Bud32/flagellar motility protein MotE (MotC chaperone)